MQLEDLKKLNADFAEDSFQMTKDFGKLFKKWMKKNPKLASLQSIHLPISILINLLNNCSENQMSKVLPELPDVFKRFMLPFLILKSSWGKIPDKAFAEEYTRLYELQFSDVSITEEIKQKFKEWYEGEK